MNKNNQTLNFIYKNVLHGEMQLMKRSPCDNKFFNFKLNVENLVTNIKRSWKISLLGQYYLKIKEIHPFLHDHIHQPLDLKLYSNSVYLVL